MARQGEEPKADGNDTRSGQMKHQQRHFVDILKLKLVGQSPILLHSDRYANPLDPLAKAHKVLTSKRTKTEEDHVEIAKSEWRGGLYYSDSTGVYVPSANIRSCIVEGAKLSKLGKAIQRGTMILSEKSPLEYAGPKTPEELWEAGDFYDCRSVVVSGKRLMRYRPMFRTWALQIEITFDPSVIESRQILKSSQDAGMLIGLGDFRPNKGGAFGRFNVEEI